MSDATTTKRGSTMTAILPDVLAEDRLLWQFWINKGMEEGPLGERLAALDASANWDYVAGNALYGGFEEELLVALRAGAARLPDGFLARLGAEVRGSRTPVLPGTPEGRLLILTASPRMTGPEEGEARGLAGGRLDWEALVQAAARANLTLAVQHNLSRLGLDTRMPSGLAEILSARARGIAARNRRMMALLDDVVVMLKQEGMRPLLLKESALALTHYGNGRLRMIGDIDLLLPEEGLDRVATLLVGKGYHQTEVLWSREHYREKHHHIAPLVQADLGVKIEPHRTIALPVAEPSGFIESLAGRAVRADAHLWCFTPADTLFHLALDLWSGAFLGKMGQACDAREVVRQGGVDWPLLEEAARAAGAEAHLALSLGLLRDLDAPVPPEVIARLEAARRPPFAAGALRRMAWRNLFGYVRARRTLTRAGEKLRFLALMQPGGRARRMAFVLRRYLYVGAPPEEGIGHIARRVRPTTRQALARLATLPVRAFRRWTSSRRSP